MHKYIDILDIFIIGGSYLYDYVYDNYRVNMIYETLNDVNISIDNHEKDKITYFKLIYNNN